MDLLFRSYTFTSLNGFTQGIEGPACDSEGNLYAVNYQRQHTIGKITPRGDCSVFIDLPQKSTGNGIRFNSKGEMLIADYTGHNIISVDMKTKKQRVLAHEPGMNQPNDICITSTDVIFASDPNWRKGTGNLWRIMPDGKVFLVEDNMGTTNGIDISPDEKTLYINESWQRVIYAYDIQTDYSLVNKRVFHRFDDGFSIDGMRCDADGNLFVTRHGKGTVIRLDPDGKPILEIHLAGKKCSNLTFGGPDGRTVYVTIADNGNIEYFRTDIPGRAFVMLKHS